jgi:hypothetical protein
VFREPVKAKAAGCFTFGGFPDGAFSPSFEVRSDIKALIFDKSNSITFYFGLSIPAAATGRANSLPIRSAAPVINARGPNRLLSMIVFIN